MARRTQYRCPDCGGTITKVGPVAPETLPCVETCGGTMVQSVGPARRSGCATWPMHSYAAAVHPSQVPEAEAHARSIGIPTSFDKEGEAVFTDPKHRKRYCEAVGLYDRNGGYSDPQRKGPEGNGPSVSRKGRPQRIWDRYPKTFQRIRRA